MTDDARPDAADRARRRQEPPEREIHWETPRWRDADAHQSDVERGHRLHDDRAPRERGALDRTDSVGKHSEAGESGHGTAEPGSMRADIRLVRAYDPPGPDDGYRVLVDRLWPRGKTKEELRLDAWERDLGPSNELRRWFGHDPARWEEFQARYRSELAAPEQAHLLDGLAQRARRGRLTIVFGARDTEHNQARVVAGEVEQRLTGNSAH